MSRRQKEPLRTLTPDERQWLERISRSHSEPSSHVIWAGLLLAVASGTSFTAAAQEVGRTSNDAVAQLVGRFNREVLAAVAPLHEGGQPQQYDDSQRQRILAMAQRPPDRAEDGTATQVATFDSAR